jgi:adenosylhomocysteine nucleosidase
MRCRLAPWLAVAAALLVGCGSLPPSPAEPAVDAVVLVSANAEWAVVRAIYPSETYVSSPFGEYFTRTVPLPHGARRTAVVLHGGWGKVSAAASTQYAIDRWNPRLLINLGTCGGFLGRIERGAVVLAERTVIYDIVERMGDPDEAVRGYATTIDLAWLAGPPPSPVVRTTLVSADQDLDPAAIPGLEARFGAVAGDWESGAIAYVAAKSQKRLLILRGVTDLVGDGRGEAYGDFEVFRRATESVMRKLFADLPLWLERAGPAR